MIVKLLLLVMVFAAVSTAMADDGGVTPYGDSCADCAAYGICKDVLSEDQAVRAMDKYYRDRGYRIGRLYHRGRFIEAVIYRKERAVDRVIFDRKTGRLRSIY